MKAHVLVVDDEVAFVDVLAERLETRGFVVHKAYGGDEALECLGQHKVDVVILDVVMPGKSGLETLHEIKHKQPLVEVIMLTGHATVETAIEGMKLGAYDYLMKPMETPDLVEKINGALARKRDHEERIRKAEINEIVRRRGW